MFELKYWRILPLCLFAAAPTVASAVESDVTVRILRFMQIDDPDPVAVVDSGSNPDSRADGDYFARVRIGSAPFERNRSDFIEDNDFRPLNRDAWVFSRTVDEGDIIPVVIQMWDADRIENNDDVIDLNPNDNVQELVLNLDLTDCTWTGDAGLNGTASQGDGDREHFGALEGGERGRIFFDLSCSDGDWDEDGIPDSIERQGIFSTDSDGGITQVLDMAGLGFDPCRKNIGVEIDFMVRAGDSHQPGAGALQAIRDSFDNAGLLVETRSPTECPYPGFPTMTGGIGLITFVDDAIPEQIVIDPDDLETIRRANMDPELRDYFHYSLWAHQVNFAGSTGRSGWCCGESGKDFIVSLSGFSGLPNGSFNDQAGTFMHELGHALGLSHAGGRDIDRNAGGQPVTRNCKPNYLSVMNYHFQTRGIVDNGTGVVNFDYSRAVLPDLNELSLTESNGVGGGDLATRWTDPTGTNRSAADTDDPANPGLDWNWSNNGTPNATGTVSVDAAVLGSAGGRCGPDSGGSTASPADQRLAGWNDWANIRFRAVLAAGADIENQVFANEPTVADAAELARFWAAHLRCNPPASGTWRIDRACTIWRDVEAAGDWLIGSNAKIRIASGVTVDVDLTNNAVRVEAGGRLTIDPGGRLN